MKTRPLAFLIVLALLSLTLAACAIPIPATPTPAAPSEAPSLAGPVWLLQNLNGASLLPDTSITAEFIDDQITGAAGCNRYFGGYSAAYPNFTLTSPLGSTMMFCEGLMDQEQAYLTALAQVARYEIVETQLILFDKEGEPLLAFVQQADAVLEGSEWQLETYLVGGDAVASPLAGSQITALFDAGKGQVSGKAGCNNYFAAYTLAGKDLTLGPVGATRMFCGDPAGLMEQESAFLILLSEVTGYEIRGNALHLLDANGAALLGFRTN